MVTAKLTCSMSGCASRLYWGTLATQRASFRRAAPDGNGAVDMDDVI